jgi:1-acyl-sn-glycerol-3-phosphate acyltransferase
MGQLLRACYSVRGYRPAGLFEGGSQRRLILAPTHQTVLDPWLLAAALEYDRWRALLPVRALATQTFHGALRWFLPLIKLLYRAEAVIELPPKEPDHIPLPAKLQRLLDALMAGDVVAIFPEGGVWKRREPPIGTFAPGVIYLHRASGAPIVPVAVWMGERRWPRRRYAACFGDPVSIPEGLDLDEGAKWLREHTFRLYARLERLERGEGR